MCTTCVTGWRHIGQMRPFFLKQRCAHAKQMPPWPHLVRVRVRARVRVRVRVRVMVRARVSAVGAPG